MMGRKLRGMSSRKRFVNAMCRLLPQQVYKVVVNSGGNSWFIFRRYNEFHALHEKVSLSVCLCACVGWGVGCGRCVCVGWRGGGVEGGWGWGVCVQCVCVPVCVYLCVYVAVFVSVCVPM